MSSEVCRGCREQVHDIGEHLEGPTAIAKGCTKAYHRWVYTKENPEGAWIFADREAPWLGPEEEPVKEMSQRKFNQMWDDHLILIHDHREADKKEDMHLIHNIYFPNCTWSGERREVKVHVDCNEDWCMLSDPAPCALFTQEIDSDDLVPSKGNSYTPSSADVRQVYDHFTRNLNLLNQNVPEGERIMMPFILQGVLRSYIEEREAIESIQEAGTRTGGDGPSRDAHA